MVSGPVTAGAVGLVGRPGWSVGRLPREGLLSYIKEVGGELQDTIGEGSITIVSGSADNLMEAEFSFDSDAVTLQADADEGGDVLFDSANAMAPIVRLGSAWYDMLNGSYIWIGSKNIIVIYDRDMIAYSSKIQRYIGYYNPAETLQFGGEDVTFGGETVTIQGA